MSSPSGFDCISGSDAPSGLLASSFGIGACCLMSCTMIHLWFFIWVCSSISSSAQQFYDSSGCSSRTSRPGSRYTCTSFSTSCPAFLVYRANQYYQTVVDISELFEADVAMVLDLNNLNLSLETLESGREVIVPITCFCSGRYTSANVTYNVQESMKFLEIACDVFEGLVKSLTLSEENPFRENYTEGGSRLFVPIKCACPGNTSEAETAKYFLTYAFKEGDDTSKVAQKFGVSEPEIWAANHLDYRSTVYPNTTIVVPLNKEPNIRSTSLVSPPPSPAFLPSVPTEKESENAKLRNLYIAVSVIGFSLIVVLLVASILCLRLLSRSKLSQRKMKKKMESFTMRSSIVLCSSTSGTPRSGQTRISSQNSCLSPDLLIGIKYSLNKYTVEELGDATRGFSDDTKIDSEVYKGSIDEVGVIIKGCESEEAERVIDLHSNINHINILSLIGVCYDESEDAAHSYLVFKYPSNGCLRDWLSGGDNSLSWNQRTRIALDVATGLHYLHHYIFPSHVHMNVKTRNIFITANWRAKLADVATMPTKVVSFKEWVAPEYLIHGAISEKVDIFAFGVVLLELISAREDANEKQFKDSVTFLAGGGNEGGCFEKLKGFVDPSLKDDYPLAEALSVAVLAKACVEDDPQHRPSMDDIIKALSRMV